MKCVFSIRGVNLQMTTTNCDLVSGVRNQSQRCVVSDLRREVDVICALLGHYAAHSGNSLPTFRVPSLVGQEFLNFLTTEDGTDRLSRNVDKKLPLNAVSYPRKTRIYQKGNSSQDGDLRLLCCNRNGTQIYQKHLAFSSTKTTDLVRKYVLQSSYQMGLLIQVGYY
jgi:hypothetical protein